MTHGSDDVPRRGAARVTLLMPELMMALVMALIMGLITGCGPSTSSGTASTRTPGDHRHDVPPSPAPPNASRAGTALEALVVEPRPRGTEGYLRDAFGSSWIDTDHDGCNQRDDVLLRDAVPGTTTVGQQGGCDHDVLAGTWHDPYTGRTLTFTDLKDLRQAEAIQIDHVVPLAEAWVSGARRWSRGEREVFANELAELLAVDGPTNMSKGDGDPASWRPRKRYQCTYARRWIAVKARYRLTVDRPERAALDQMLGYCR
jgi:uncharacterized protein DUF1524